MRGRESGGSGSGAEMAKEMAHRGKERDGHIIKCQQKPKMQEQ